MKYLKIFIIIYLSAYSAIAFSEETIDEQVCKACIAKIMYRDPSTIKIDRIQKNEIYLSYIRSSDNKKWKYKCRLEGNRVLWGSDTGRWRNDPMDSKITYKIKNNKIHIIEDFGDGSGNEESYPIKE